MKNSKKMNSFRERNIVLALVLILLLSILLGALTRKEVQREKYYLWQLAQSEGLNIAFSIEAIGPRLVLNQNILKEILILLKKEGVNYIDICTGNGKILLSTEEERRNTYVNLKNPGKVNYLTVQDKKGERILQVIKPFQWDIDKQLTIWDILPVRNSYLVVGVNLESYYQRLSQIRSRIIFNYGIIMALVLFGIYVVYKLQENYIIKKTLNEMKDYTTTLLETMDNAVISIDKNGLIKTFNRKSEEIFLKTRKEVLNKNCQDVLDIKIDNMCLLRKAILEKRNVSREIILKENGFSRKILDISTSFLNNESGEMVGLVAVIRDVTEIKSLNEEVARNNRLASLGKLSAGIAHEIRNPLSSIRGLAQFIGNSFKKDDARREDLDTIIQEVDRLNHLIVQVLDFAKIRKLNITHFSINQLIKKTVELLKIESNNKKIKFHLSLSEEIPNIYADENQIRQILLNIIVNSVQAINFQGDIFVTSEVIQYREKSGVKIMIEDNGTGIPESDIPKVFDPFFTKKETGTGLGLSIVYKLVENHQGEVKIESKEGSGTKFTIILPQKGVK